jgi:hypothetical protein
MIMEVFVSLLSLHMCVIMCMSCFFSPMRLLSPFSKHIILTLRLEYTYIHISPKNR